VTRPIVHALGLAGAVCAICVGLGLLIGHYKHSPPSRAIPISLYIGGAVLMVGSLGGALSGRTLWRAAWDDATIHDEMARRFQPGRGVYVGAGLLLIGLGVFFDWLL
jgi:hypothetical protein